MTEERRELFLGMISGTSRDGVDAALVDFTDGSARLIAALCQPYPQDIAAPLGDLVNVARKPTVEQAGSLDERLARHFATTVDILLSQAGVKPHQVIAIGSHGQTVWHDPDSAQPESLQLGNPQRIANLTGITTVGDFRTADIAAGGQGAPLAPLLHRALFRPVDGKCVVLNLGGIANISILDAAGNVSGYDTGPANCLMDAWVRQQLGKPFDRDGAWAASGQVHGALLDQLAADSYFARPAPKSTGVEYFNLNWLESQLPAENLAPRDIQATLAELTAITVADAIKPHQADQVLVCGGGAHNTHLIARIEKLLPGSSIHSTATRGLDPDSIEAILFAWLARKRLAGRKMDTRTITGAKHPVALGTINPPTV